MMGALGGWARIAKQVRNCNPAAAAQANPRTGLAPWVYDTVRFK